MSHFDQCGFIFESTGIYSREGIFVRLIKMIHNGLFLFIKSNTF